MPLFLRFFHSVRPAMMPLRIVCNPPNRRCASEGGAHGNGLNNSQYLRNAILTACSCLNIVFLIVLRPMTNKPHLRDRVQNVRAAYRDGWRTQTTTTNEGE